MSALLLNRIIELEADRDRLVETFKAEYRARITAEHLVADLEGKVAGLRLANSGLLRALVDRTNANLDRAEAIARDLGVLGTAETQPAPYDPAWRSFDGGH